MYPEEVVYTPLERHALELAQHVTWGWLPDCHLDDLPCLAGTVRQAGPCDVRACRLRPLTRMVT